MRRLLLPIVSAALMAQGQEYTRGIGVYPGDPKEDFSPVMAVDSATYRNLALHRPAYHSSSYDYNLTAQLVTNGIKSAALPRWISTATNDGAVPTKTEPGARSGRQRHLRRDAAGREVVVPTRAGRRRRPAGGGSLRPGGARAGEPAAARRLEVHRVGFRRWPDVDTADKAVSDVKQFQAGVRQFTYSEEGNSLKMWINGRRFIARGGNWGFSESMLRYRAREYDVAVRYERDEHFTMIRNWVGLTGDEAFYDACDKYGIVVWQDFWLANPSDGPNPDDNDLFLRNARDYVLKIRNHASMGLYCGRNEGMPPRALDDGLKALTEELNPGLHYIPSSADDNTSGNGTYVVTGHGPYRNEPQKYYFATPPVKFHSEMGSPNVVTMDSLRLTMPESAMWPQGNVWPMHDFSLTGAFPGAIAQSFGAANNIEEWVTLAQFVDYDAYRGMFEGQSKSRLGLLIWMSHCAWPSLLWQTYDYFFDPDAGYLGAKKGSEPLHIQWNAAADTVEVVNYSAGEARGLSAHAEIIDMDGSLKWEKTAALDSAEDSTASPIKLEFPTGLTPVHFIRLTLTRGAGIVSTNFYLRGERENDYHAIRELPKVKLEAATKVERQGARWLLTTELRNVSARPALMVHLKVVREKSGDRILPALYNDNYVSLMPGERQTIRTELNHADTRGERPRMVVEGFNTGEVVER